MINRNTCRCTDKQTTVSLTDNQSDKDRPKDDKSEMGVKMRNSDKTIRLSTAKTGLHSFQY